MSWKLGFVIEIPIIVLETTKTFTDTTTLWFFFLFGFGTGTALLTILVLFKNSVTHFIPMLGFFFDLVISIVSRWTIEHQPSCRKARMRPSNYNNIFHFLFIDFFESSFETIFLQELSSHYNFFFVIFQKWKPF